MGQEALTSQVNDFQGIRMNKALLKICKENSRFIIFIFLMVVFRSSLADWNAVPSGSMKPTIIEGDRLWVDKLAYDVQFPFSYWSIKHLADPQRGDIVVFNSKVSDIRLVKRVIGLPGETVSMENNILVINGERLTYHIQEETDGVITAREQFNSLDHLVWIDKALDGRLSNFDPVTIPKGHYLMLGDNRNNSADSRVIGFVPGSEIIGRTESVVMSLDYDNYYIPRSDRFLKSL